MHDATPTAALITTPGSWRDLTWAMTDWAIEDCVRWDRDGTLDAKSLLNYARNNIGDTLFWFCN
ncbi:hypothetical protein A5681_09835 [Mycobacterium scrofulaceum]|uniref:hypothetical protein n=1 Tax=Mycobacterium scrofulaceum TaxID=1783 RepID=UPI000801C772|nr:hypothetical protein [Mycobacterium scrofulaceum]OBH75929.1 hypothetical protein A5681_09835 [Mycobacterium scrofulaceum]